MSKIAIIGTGKMGQNLGKALANGGNTILFGSRSPEAKLDLAGWTGVTTIEDAIGEAEIVIITLPYTAVEPFAREHANRLRGKLVIDITNPFSNLPDNRISGPEITANAIGAGARVVAAFKTNFHNTLLSPLDANGVQRDVFFAGDSEADKQIVAGLIQGMGFRPVDCGALKNARVLDGMVPLMIELNGRYNGNRELSWKLLP
jgi:NADPH-dependent F420 reductase